MRPENAVLNCSQCHWWTKSESSNGKRFGEGVCSWLDGEDYRERLPLAAWRLTIAGNATGCRVGKLR